MSEHAPRSPAAAGSRSSGVGDGQQSSGRSSITSDSIAVAVILLAIVQLLAAVHARVPGLGAGLRRGRGPRRGPQAGEAGEGESEEGERGREKEREKREKEKRILDRLTFFELFAARCQEAGSKCTRLWAAELLLDVFYPCAHKSRGKKEKKREKMMMMIDRSNGQLIEKHI